MKLSQTTLAGSFAAGTLAASECPGLPHGIQVSLVIASAACLGWLGHRANDCPPGCPGTDDQGRPIKRIRTPIFPAFLAGLAGLIALATLLTGCVSSNPNAGKGNPPGPAYVVSPALLGTSNVVVGIAPAIGTATNTGGVLPLAAAGLFAILGSLSAAYARHKSEVAATLADGIAVAGQSAIRTVLTNSADSTKFAAVADLLNNRTPTGQAPGDATPSTTAK